MGMRLLRLCVAEGLQQCITCSIVPRPSHSQRFNHLQHREGLGDFHMIVMNSDRGRRVRRSQGLSGSKCLLLLLLFRTKECMHG